LSASGAARPSGRARRVGTGLIGLLVSAAAVAALVTVIDVRETAEALGETNLWLVAATMLLVPGQIILRTLRWRLLLPLRADGRRPSVGRVMPVLLVGYLANLVLPARLGEPARAYLLARREQIGFPRVLGSVLLERVIDLASLAFVAVLAALQARAPEWIVRGMVIVAIVGFVIVVVLVASGIARAVGLLARIFSQRAGRMRAAIEHAISFGEGANGGGFGPLAAAIVLSTLTWGFVAGTYWLAAQSLALDIRISESMLVAAVATLGTAIPSAPANIGTYEVATVVVLTALGVEAHEALAMALLTHAIVTVPFAITGAASVAHLSISLSDVADEATSALPTAPTVEAG
jgi:uncharacterized protein (TIRG00374 family)